MTVILVDLDGALGDTRPLWEDWLSETARVLGIDAASLPADRGAAAAELDAAGVGNWRTLLERYASDRAPVYLRPSADVSAALRRLAATDRVVGVFTDAPAELAQVAVAQLGVSRRMAALETGDGALARLTDAFGPDTVVIRTRAELLAVAGS